MRYRAILPALAALLLATACDALVPPFFRPASETSPDRSPPRFSDPRPATDVVIVNDDAFTIEVTDPSGEGTPASGIPPGGITATRLGAGPLPVMLSPPLVTIDVSDVPDGQIQIGVNARDRAGNSALFLFSHVLDTTPPELAFPGGGPLPARQTSDPTTTITIRVTANDAHFDMGTILAATPGPDGTCGTADDGAIPSEILADPERTFEDAGTATVQFVFSNPVPQGGAARTDAYCWNVTATDTARAIDGSPAPNEATISGRTDVTWGPPA